jgi:hypothetical protein
LYTGMLPQSKEGTDCFSERSIPGYQDVLREKLRASPFFPIAISSRDSYSVAQNT